MAVLLLVTGVALLVVVLAVTANKLNKLRAEKAHTDSFHCYTERGGGERKAKKAVNDEVGERRQPQLKDRVGNIRSWNWGQWKGDIIPA